MSKEISRRNFLKIAGAVGITAASATFAYKSFTEDPQEPRKTPQPSSLTDSPRPTIEPTPLITASPEPTPVPTPEKPAISAEMALLRESLASEIDAYKGETSIAITDIKSGEAIEVNGNRPQLPGCVANLACALAVVSELSNGTAKFTKEQVEPNLTTMVRHSDPSAGLKVVTMLGGGSVEEGVRIINSKLKEWKMDSCFYDHPPSFSITYSLNNRDNQIAASEMNATLTKLAKSELFNLSEINWNEYALWVMENNKPGLNFIIPGQIPNSEATVAHKVGWVPGLPATINDSGVVKANDSRFVYVITFMHQDLENPATESALFNGPGVFGSKLSKITYDMFVQKYPKI